GFLGGSENGGQIHLASAKGDIVAYVRVAGEIAFNPFLEILNMHQLETFLVLLEQGHGVLPGMHNPENDHLVGDELLLVLLYQQIEKRAILIRLKFVSVRVIEKLQVMFGQRFSGFIENSNGIPALLLIEV